MVRGGRSGSSSRRGIRGRALFPASVSGSPSSERTPPLPSGLVAGPSSASPSVPAAVGASSESPPVVAEPASIHESYGRGAVSICMDDDRKEKELKRQPTFSEVFDRTHKKKGTYAYISDRARVVAQSYSQQMTEKYVGEDEQPPLDPEVWVAASGAPKKGHVYGFGHSIDTSQVLSGGSSSGSQTSAFHAGVGTPGTSPGQLMGFIDSRISSLESRLADSMETRLAQM
ncbi:hypothetical protein Taro_003168 [Colocasia esculenta]|uniref:Uncharacterized protein n=1 Tax=Colocasia esculenta TaxID=4460 RepID=A0A843TII8_COLES|nr:hypothetical protein [Colocasia esculenta]